MTPGLLLTVEHASAAIPAGVHLGLSPEVQTSHIGWDPGARELAEALAEATGAPLIVGAWSRLVVDLNRRATDPGVVPEVAFGTVVPGNVGLSNTDRQARLARWHHPWRQAVALAVEALVARCGTVLHLSVHSFTPALDPAGRAFDLGLLFDPARPVERTWAQRLGTAGSVAGASVRENAPYAGTDEGHTTFLRERWPPDTYAGLELELSQAVSATDRVRLAHALGTALCG
jgi:predicted N-formylglutamate amidohydrolase